MKHINVVCVFLGFSFFAQAQTRIAYVGGGYGTGVQVVDIDSMRVLRTIPDAGGYRMVLSSDGKKLYSTGGNSFIYVTDAEADTLLKMFNPSQGSITTNELEAIAISPDGSRVYVFDESTDALFVVDTQTDTVVAVAQFIFDEPENAVVSPDGAYVYMIDNRKVVKIRTDSLSIVGQAYVNNDGHGIGISADGTKLYADGNGIILINASTMAGLDTLGGDGYYIEASKDGTRVYGVNEGSVLTVIDATSDEILASITLSRSNARGVTSDAAGTIILAATGNGLLKLDAVTFSELGSLPGYSQSIALKVGAAASGQAFDLAPVFSPESQSPIISFHFFSLAGSPVISGITVHRTGSATNSDVPSAKLYRDNNQNNIIDGPDSQLGTTQTFSNDIVVFSNLNFTPTTNVNLLLVYVISSSAITTRTTGATINLSDILGGNGTVVTFSGISTGNYVLPIEITSFAGNIVRGSVLLNWTTVSEINNNGFGLERKTVGVSPAEWTEIGFVAGSGTSNSPHEYSFTDNNLSPGRYLYRIKQIDNDGSFKYYGNAEVEVPTPLTFALEQNYPNPFNPSTVIRYALPTRSALRLQVFDALGQRLQELVNSEQDAGYHEVTWQPSVTSGFYLYRIEAVAIDNPQKRFIETRKLLFLK